MQGVLFASLLVVELEASEVQVGVAQSALMAPAVVLMLLGGAVADRGDRRKLLILFHTLAALLTVGLAEMSPLPDPLENKNFPKTSSYWVPNLPA